MEEFVVLVNEHNQPIGTAPKSQIHTAQTPLHRGISVFLFDRQGRLLLQQRSVKKKTWPLIWSNSCCGHPMPGESNLEAARRRLQWELGITEAVLYEILPHYRYKAEKDGVVENEICPVLIAFTSQTPRVNPDEVEAIRRVRWPEFIRDVRLRAENYSIWCVEEALLLSMILHGL